MSELAKDRVNRSQSSSYRVLPSLAVLVPKRAGNPVIDADLSRSRAGAEPAT
jgi:hypothetical protein